MNAEDSEDLDSFIALGCRRGETSALAVMPSSHADSSE